MFGNKYLIDFKKDINNERVLKVLQYYENEEVNAWELSFGSKVLHYTQAIMELRSRGHNIINRTEHKGRVMHSFYKLIVEDA